jgi:hypothetical protein
MPMKDFIALLSKATKNNEARPVVFYYISSCLQQVTF